MRQFARIGLLALAAAALAPAAPAQDNPAAPAPASNGGEALATVNGEPITQRELLEILGQFQIPPGDEPRAYEAALDYAINTRILEQFLKRSGVPVPPAEVQNVFEQYRKNLGESENASTLEATLKAAGTTPEEFKARIARSLQWKNYVRQRATDAELTRYINQNADAFAQTRVKASHILLKVKPDATDAEKAEVRQRLESIKNEIESGAISFADAANKYSEDDANQAVKSGGDLGYFARKSQFVEEFAAAAFALKDQKLGTISDPVETDFGYHLIQLTDVQPGQTIDPKALLAQNKQQVLNLYAVELQSQVVKSERDKLQAEGKIETKPMPPDLFKLLPPPPKPPATNAAPAPPQGTN